MSAGGDEGQRPVSATGGAASGSGDSTWGYYLAAALLTLLGVTFLNDFRYALAAQTRWAQAAGRVTDNAVVVHRGRKSTSYNTFISYEYTAEGGSYSAGPLELNKFKLYFTEGGAQDDLDDNFARGKSITVYYNPSDPSESSLGLAGAPGIAVPIAFFLLAFGAVYVARQQF